MKIGELISRIQALYNKGVASDDNRLSNRLIYNKLLTTRARLISQEIKKKQRISRWNYQTLSCIELIEVPEHDCPCLPPVGCMILRTRNKLPKPINGLSGHIIESVTTVNKQERFSEVSPSAIKYQKGNKYSSNSLQYFIHNNFIYISTPTKIRLIDIVGLFEDPIEVESYKGYCSDKKEDCKDCDNCLDYMNQDFPIENDMIDVLVELTVQEVIGLFRQGYNDLYNDSREVQPQVNNNGK